MKRSLFLSVWTYFRKGDQTYGRTGMWIVNAITVQLIFWQDKIPFDPGWAVLAVLLSYFCFGVLSGRWHFKQGAQENEIAHTVKANPYARDMAAAMKWLVVSSNRWGEDEKALVRKLDRWASPPGSNPNL